MYRLLPILCLLLTFAANIGMAQSSPVTVYCGECRHPHQHPDDYVNHAFNQVYGPNAWMNFSQADDFFIVNPHGMRVYVDIDFQFLGIGWEGLRLPFWPTNMLKITLALPNGNIYEAMRSVFQISLPVPANKYDDPAYGTESDSGSGVDGDEAEGHYHPFSDPHWPEEC